MELKATPNILHFLAIFLILICSQAQAGVESGKLEIYRLENYVSRCQYVSFKNSFSSGTPLRVFISINHGNESMRVQDSSFIWVEDVTTSGFQACLMQGARGNRGNTTIDWFALQGSQSGVYHGEASFSLFTTGTKCKQVAFSQVFSLVPKVHVTVKHGTPNQKQDAMSVWIESVTTNQFEVCLQESRTFDGPHNNLVVNWMASTNYPPSWEAKESAEVVFSEKEVPTAENSYALCKNVSFANPFYTAPVIILTVLNGGRDNGNTSCPSKGPLMGWLEEVTNTNFRVCIKDSAGYDGQRHDVIVDYLVIGEFDECSASVRVCDVNATCQNTLGSYTCSCKAGFTGDGKSCTDVDECSTVVRVCDANATCQNTQGSYLCSCKAGFTGDGKTCTDVDECNASVNVCDVNAECKNTPGSYRCTCKAEFTGDGRTCRVVKNCGDLYKYGKRRSGVYTINPDGLGAFAVFCDQQTAGGGWTVFQKRMDGSVDFYRVWADYKRGFGNLTGEFWLGLDKIDRLTNIGENKLRVDLVDFAGNTAYAEYGLFTVSSENTGYWLEVGDYSGTAGDSLRYHSGYSFSTKDRDNDQSNHNCAEGCKGAWWYNACCQSNLNGLYYHGHNEDGDGIIWYRWKRYTSLKKAEMKMKLVTV